MDCCQNEKENHHKQHEHVRHEEGHSCHGDHGGHHDHKGHPSAREFLKKFWVSGIATVLVLVLPFFKGYLSDTLVSLGQLFISVFVFWWGGQIFVRSAYHEIKGRNPGMMTLISVGIGSALVWSLIATFIGKRPLWWELTSLIAVMLLGHYFEMRAVSETQGALKELAKLLPATAHRVKDSGETEDVPVTELARGDVVLIKPGEKVPADGVIIEGESELIEALLTGESLPVPKKAGDRVIGGSQNTNGVLKVRVEKVGEESFISQVMQLVEEAQKDKTRFREVADRLAGKLTYVAIFSGLFTFVSWLVFSQKGIVFAVERAVAVLVISCPHALGLAVPLVSSISTYLGAYHGILIRNKRAFELGHKITTVLFDKTGTLTEGKFEVVEIYTFEGSQKDLLSLAVSLEKGSEHPLAEGILKEAERKGVKGEMAQNVERLGGKGIAGRLGETKIWAGNLALAQEFEASDLKGVEDILHSKENELGATGILVGRDKRVLGIIFLRDKIREGAREAIEGLKKLGIKTAMITGDTENVAKQVAGELGLDEYFARVLPDQKHQKVIELQERGEIVAMVGDGINDAPALMRANLGIALGSGTNVAIESADVLLVSNDPKGVLRLIELSRQTYKKMIQNLFWATSYNSIAIPLAGGILAFKGIIFSPALGAVFMSLSTIIVAFNALSLKSKGLKN